MNFSESIEPVICGNYTVKIADCNEETNQAFKLRYTALRKDYNPDLNSETEIDRDSYDDYCSHMVVNYFDESTQKSTVVATYRLISEDHLINTGKFLSEDEFDISLLKKNKKGKILELGRAVVAPEHRNGIVIKILWKGIERYAVKYSVSYLIGTASFHGLDCEPYRDGYHYLMQNYKMDENLLAVSVRPLIPSASDCPDKKTASEQIPSLIKSYLRMGCKFGEGFFLDRSFNCLDMFIFMDMEKITQKYLEKNQNH